MPGIKTRPALAEIYEKHGLNIAGYDVVAEELRGFHVFGLWIVTKHIPRGIATYHDCDTWDYRTSSVVNSAKQLFDKASSACFVYSECRTGELPRIGMSVTGEENIQYLGEFLRYLKDQKVRRGAATDKNIHRMEMADNTCQKQES